MISIVKQNYNDVKQFNRVEKAYFTAQLFWVVSIAIFTTLTPLIVKLTTGETALTGLVSTTYMWTLTASLLFTGDILKRFSMQKALLTTSMLRALLFTVLTLLLFSKQVNFQFLVILFAMSGLISSFSYLLDLDSGGINKVFSTADKKARALYLFKFFDYLCLLILPIVLGIVIDHLSKHIGPYNTLGMAFILLCATLITSANIYLQHLYIPEDNKKNSEKTPLRKVFTQTPTRIWRTCKIVWHYKTIRLRFAMISFESMIDSAMMVVILPTFALDILHMGATGNGLFIGAMSIGGLLATMMLLANAEKLQKKYGFYKYIFWLAILSCLSFLPTLLLWMYPIFSIAIASVVLIKFLYEPLRCRMDSLLQIEVNGNAEAKKEQENIFSLLTLIWALSAGMGSMLFAFIFIHSSPGTILYAWLGAYAPMKIVSIVFFIFSAINLVGIIWFKHHIYHTYKLSYITEKEELSELERDIDELHMVHYVEEFHHGKARYNRPTIALLAPPTLDNVSIAYAGSQLAPGDIHLVLDPSWLLEELQYDGTNRLYLKKGIYFDREGDPILAHYKEPRRIHYYSNFYTTTQKKNECIIQLENKLDVPMGCSSVLEYFLNENSLLRIWLSAHEMHLPKTLAFLMPKHAFSRLTVGNRTIEIVLYPRDQNSKAEIIHKKLTHFLKSYNKEYIVIKPSGVGFVPPYGVQFFAKDDISNMVDYIIQLAQDPLMTEQCSILVEQRVYPLPLYLEFNKEDGSGRYCILQENIPLHILTPDEIANAAESCKKEWIIHALVARSPWGQCVITSLIARAGEYGQPLSSNAAIIPFENIISAIRIQHQLLMTDEEVSLLEEEVEHFATKILSFIEEETKNYKHQSDGPLQAQIDCFGLDFILENVDKKLVFTLIAVHDHNAGKEYQFDKVYPEKTGAHSIPWLVTMLTRARKSMYRDKRLILVGAGSVSNKKNLEEIMGYGLHIILIDNEDSWAKELASEFISIDMKQMPIDISQAFSFVSRSIESFGSIDGITTFSQEYLVFTAELARELKLLFLDVANARMFVNKLKTRKVLNNFKLSTPCFFYVKDESSLDIALRQIATMSHKKDAALFPMILKPVQANERIHSKKVNTPEEARTAYREVSNIVQGQLFVIEEFISGKAFDVFAIVQHGKIKYASVMDVWSDATLTEHDHIIYSIPSKELSHQEQMACINLAILALQELEIENGVIHVSGKYDATKEGAEIFEISAGLSQENFVAWQKIVWGVDIMELSLAIALQIPIHIYRQFTPLTYLECYYFTTCSKGVFNSWHGIDVVQHYEGFKEFTSFVQEGEKIDIEEKEQFYLGCVLVEGDNKESVLENLRLIVAKIYFILETEE